MPRRRAVSDSADERKKTTTAALAVSSAVDSRSNIDHLRVSAPIWPELTFLHLPEPVSLRRNLRQPELLQHLPRTRLSRHPARQALVQHRVSGLRQPGLSDPSIL